MCNHFRRKIENGETVYGARAATFSPRIVEVYGQLGFDYVWLDFEHAGPSPYNSVALEELSRAAQCSDIELLVRLPSGDPTIVRKALDNGINNLLIPRIKTASDLEPAVSASQYVYGDEPGKRGAALGRFNGYGNQSEYVHEEDDTVCVGGMIENPTAISNIESIVSVSHLGFVFVGPGDLSIQMGHPGDPEHRVVQDAIETISDAARAADVPVGGIDHELDGAIEKRENGYQILRVGGELDAARSRLGERLTALRERNGARRVD